MNTPRPCGCKGRRTCLLCEKDFKLEIDSPQLNKELDTYVYCYLCNKAWLGWNIEDNLHPNHHGNSIDYCGIYIDPNFLSKAQEDDLISNIDKLPWDLSQSGRRKQNYGPKCNFKKQKIKPGNFCGFPKSTKFIQDKFSSVPIMKGFQTIEQCSLEYDPIRGAAIDPHVDDCWIWGERIVTVNLLSDSVLTMTYNNKPNRYNLNCVKYYSSVLDNYGKFNLNCNNYTVNPLRPGNKYPIVRIPMPRRSLFIMYNAARYDWEHQILREDIISRRICIAYREFTPPYLDEDKKTPEIESILDKAKYFWDG